MVKTSCADPSVIGEDRSRSGCILEIKMKTISPTPYPDVNEILAMLLSNVRETLQDQLVGMYLFGSLANGDFDELSDIDVLVATNTVISKHQFIALKQMHKG